MNYIYDILLNFNEKYYDFYEWDENVIHIKKIPFIKISDEQMNIIYNNKVKINNINLNTFIIYCSEFVMAIKLNKKGIVIERSSLLFEDSDEVLSEKKDIKKLDIEVIKPIKHSLITKEDYELKKYLTKELDRIINDKNYNFLLYIYYECFNIKESNINKVINELKKVIKEDLTIYNKKIYNILKLTINK